MDSKKVAIVHDYFSTYGGAEKTVESWITLYPGATIYTNFITLSNFQGTVFDQLYKQGQIKTTAEQYILGNNRPTLFKLLFWAHPLFARFGIHIPKNTDLILLSSIYSAKYTRFPSFAKIIHYCHSATRFLYPQMRANTRDRLSQASKKILLLLAAPLRAWDQSVVKKLVNNRTTWLTNSSYNQQLLKEIYNTNAAVVYPPVDISRFSTTARNTRNKQAGYIVYSRIVPIKKIERAILACIECRTPLTIIGEASDSEYLASLQTLITSLGAESYIRITGDIPDLEKIRYFSSTRAMIFPELEDFGIAPIEVIAAGVPIIATEGAGALEYIQDGVNGAFFQQGSTEEKTIYNLTKAIKNFDPEDYTTATIRQSVQRFKDLHNKDLLRIIQELG